MFVDCLEAVDSLGKVREVNETKIQDPWTDMGHHGTNSGPACTTMDHETMPLPLESCAKVRALELLTQKTSPRKRDDCIVCILARRWLSWRQCTVFRLCSSLWCMYFLRTMRKRYLPALSKDRHL